MAIITKSIGSSSRDYSTITTWEAALSGAAGGAGNDAVGECYNDSTFAEICTINDGTPDSIVLTAATGEEHDGTVGSGVKIEPTANSSGGAVTLLGDKKTSISKFEISGDGAPLYMTKGVNTNGGAVGIVKSISRCLIHGIFNTVGGNTDAVVGPDSNRIMHLLNNIIYDISVGESSPSGALRGVIFGSNANPLYVQNNTIYGVKTLNTSSTGTTYGIVSQDDVINTITQNNIVCGLSTAGTGAVECFNFATTLNVVSNHNLSSDTTAIGTGSLTSKAAADQFVSIVSGSEDLHLKTGADAIGAGTDLGTTPTGVNIDINGRDRDDEGDTWDIGAHQFVSGSLPIDLTGTLSDGATESEIVSGGQELVLTLDGDTWVAAGDDFNAQRQNIIDGLNSAFDTGATGTAWNAEVRDKLDVTQVVRTSNTEVTITF